MGRGVRAQDPPALRARRENRPSIIFIDEIDALAGSRGQVEVHDSHVNQLLAEIDGVPGSVASS